MFKKFFFQIHWFLGITAGLILSIMGVTGAIYSYQEQIQQWIRPESYTVQVPENRAKLTPTEIYQHFQSIDPNIKINSITINKPTDASSSINIVKEGARKGYNMMVNPYTADVLPEIKGKDFFDFILKIHRTLVAGEFGKQLTGACTLMLLYFIFSGLYLRWPKKHTLRQWLAIKPKLKGRNFLWDLHAVVGTWMIIFYLLLACSGLFWSYDWWRGGMYAVFGVERPAQMQNTGDNNKGKHGGERGKDQARAENAQDNKSAQSQPTKDKNSNEKGDKQGLTPEQIEPLLVQTWAAIHSNLGHEYSSITLNIPKKADGQLDITFIDAIPQHERARNKATYNTQTHQFEKLDLYAAKSLNEKIMASMLAVHRGNFFGSVYQFLVMLAALAMPLFFVTGWMLYLKRRKQKKLTLAARELHPVVTTHLTDKPWLIVYASQTGLAEQLAWKTASSLQQANVAAAVIAIQKMTVDDLKNTDHVLFVASTYGTGDAPDLATAFVKKIMNQTIDLSHLNYAVLALGSKEYPETYCHFGHEIDHWLQHNAAHMLYPVIEVDNGNIQDIQKWNTALASTTQLDLQAVSIEKTFTDWTLLKRDLLNPESLGAPAFNIELHSDQAVHWQAGDIAEIQTGNSANRLARFIKQQQIQTGAIVESSQNTIEQALRYKDLTQSVSFDSLDELVDKLPLLPIREYSIASIPSQQILRLVVRQKCDDNGELGLGSGWLTQHISVQDQVKLNIRNNAAFHLIEDDRPIICIGNGTGIAGLMSLLSQRVERKQSENWLIFGERQYAHDYFYQDTIQSWQNMGMLKHLDLAFSRDQEHKIYVHHKLTENAELLKQWIENDAVIYVCGSINGMASDVDQALNNILGEEKLEQLKQTERYKRDVY